MGETDLNGPALADALLDLLGYYEAVVGEHSEHAALVRLIAGLENGLCVVAWEKAE